MDPTTSTSSIKVFVILLVIFCQCSGPIQEQQDAPPAEYSIEQFMNTIQIFGSSFSPDESKLLINSKESGVYNVYEIDLATSKISPLTYSENEAIFGQSYFPEDDRIIYSSDKGGNEISHLYIRETNGKIKELTTDSLEKAQFYGWSHDKQSFLYVSNKRDPRFFDLFETRIDDSKKEGEIAFRTSVIYKNEEGLNPSSLSDDKKYMALTRTITTNNSDMYLLNTNTGQVDLISEHQGDVQYSPQFFSADSKKLYYLTNENYEFMYLKRYDLVSKTSEVVKKADWDISYVYESRNRKYRVTAINNDAKTEITVYDLAAGSELSLPALPEGEITSVNISDSENLMSFYVSSSKSPNNIYLYNFNTKDVKQLSNTMNPEIAAKDLVHGEIIRYKSFDGMDIPALLYKPLAIRSGEKVPALLWIHGGPGGQSRLNYIPRLQYLANHGYAVLAVNNRGSSGYGKSFYAADDQKHGQDDLMDCVEAKKYLQGLDFIDPDKIGIMGGSYGGYMVMAALAFQPEEFAVGVNYFGVTNWLRTLNSIPSWWESFREALYKEMGNPVTDSLMLYNKSPLFHADKITKPFIVLQGANDPRVLKVESDEIVAAAKTNNVPVEYVVFDDEGHGFLKKENNISASKAVLAFLDKHLKKSEYEE